MAGCHRKAGEGEVKGLAESQGQEYKTMTGSKGPAVLVWGWEEPEAGILLSGSHVPYAQFQVGPGDYPSLSQATRMLGEG